jgi:hypothetical protein
VHFDGSTWTVVPTPNVNSFGSSLHAVDATAPADVWGVGHYITEKGRSKQLILHYDGTAWSVVPSPNPKHTSRALDGIVAVNFRTDAWAVGWTQSGSGNVRPLVEHWDVSEWSDAAVPGPPESGELFDIDRSVDDRIVAVGVQNTGTSSKAFALQLKDEAWTISPVAPSGGTYEQLVAVDARYDILAAGAFSNGDGPSHTLVERFSTATNGYSIEPSPDQGEAGSYLTDIASFPSGASSAWAVGGYANPDAGSFRPGNHTLIERRTC